MCNVITLRYICTHTVRQRRSTCNGTKHKQARSGIRAACSSESSLTLFSKIACGPCQHRIWDERWLAKIVRANEFINKCKRDGIEEDVEVSTLYSLHFSFLLSFPITKSLIFQQEELHDLTIQLTQEYTSASWLIHRTLPTHAKPRPPRVKTSTYARTSSPLVNEVLPADLEIYSSDAKKNWFDMKEDEYDGDYVASTDPLHPVCTEYPDLMDESDMSGRWVFQHDDAADEQEDEVWSADGEGAFEFDSSVNDWSWGEPGNAGGAENIGEEGARRILSREERGSGDVCLQNAEVGSRVEGREGEEEEEIPSSSTRTTTMTGVIQHEELNEGQEDRHTEQQRKRIIKEFWKVVNEEGD